MARTFLDALAEVTGDTILVDRSSVGAVREARANLWTFAMTHEQALGTTTAQVEHFLQAVIDARSRELVTRHDGHPMYFYCWCDEQAAQLRFSLVSALHEDLPFAGPIILAPHIGTIVALFLALPHHDGIPLDASLPSGIANDVSSAADTAEISQQTLAVWIRRLPVQLVPLPE